MKYKVLYTTQSEKDIKKLDAIVRKKIKIKIENFSQKPLFFSKKLTDRRLGQYRFRAGNHRIIFDIDKDKIIILKVGHRSKIYK